MDAEERRRAATTILRYYYKYMWPKLPKFLAVRMREFGPSKQRCENMR
jgi:hypothetical protein